MNNYYYTITEVLDFGPHITKVILDAGRPLGGAALDTDLFTVTVKRTSKQGEDFVWPTFMGEKPDDSMKGARQVTDLYISDKEGNPEADGSCITLEMYCDPRQGIGSIIRFDGNFNVFVDVAYTVTQTKPLLLKDGTAIEGMVFDRDGGNRVIYGEWLQTETFDHPDGPLSYVYYEPRQDAEEKIPLIIWLHGAGEGGHEPAIAAIGNKVVNLISPKMQAYFGGKAYLLAPQSPTMWLDNGSGEYTLTGVSKYTESLEALIDAFVKAHPSIDAGRIYLGGCSNGGFMTMLMLLRNPARYAAAFPVCEALYDEVISEEDIAVLAELPIWFVHSANDPVVDPEKYALATYKRLIAAGAKDVHITYYDKVTDSTGLYKKEDGEPYEYIGHWTWVPMLNNECTLDYDKEPVKVDGKPVTILEWLASHKKA
ncbi:MAG: prolyl oligopeptidase family serine peptidase [Eubacteriales bacterium]|nr:prolyl oligopeptidase family serine peptidase [Eubacteriales bacterium]